MNLYRRRGMEYGQFLKYLKRKTERPRKARRGSEAAAVSVTQSRAPTAAAGGGGTRSKAAAAVAAGAGGPRATPRQAASKNIARGALEMHTKIRRASHGEVL